LNTFAFLSNRWGALYILRTTRCDYQRIMVSAHIGLQPPLGCHAQKTDFFEISEKSFYIQIENQFCKAMRKGKNQEAVERLYNQYAGVNVKKLSDDELDRQIVEIGRQCLLQQSEQLCELLEDRKSERWMRKAKEPIEGNLEEINEKFRRFVETVYEDTLDTAQSLKEELDAGDAPCDHKIVVESQLYVESFSSNQNKFADEENDLPGLLDILMDAESMINNDFCPITFVIEKGKEIEGPTYDELFCPAKRDAAWNYLLNEMPHLPAARLCYPLQKLFLDRSAAMQDILAIRRFDFCTVQWTSHLN